MKLSRKITAIATLAVILICMSGYAPTPQSILDHFTLPSTETGADKVKPQSASSEKAEDRYQALLDYRDHIEEQSCEIAFKHGFIELNGGVYRIMGKRRIGSIIRLSNGYLASIALMPSVLGADNAKNTAALHEYLKERSIDFYYVSTPITINKYDTQLPKGLECYINEDSDRFISQLHQSGVPVIDLRNEMQQSGQNHYDYFFRTDHHWKPEAGLWAAGVVMNKYLPHHKQGDIDYYDIANYDITVYKNFFLGSRGRRVGRLYAGIDDISIITPKFETNLRVAPGKRDERTGSFAEAIIDKSMLKRDLYNLSPYDAYIGGVGSTRIWNQNGNGKKLLIIGDSFSLTFIPFIALDFSETFQINPEHYDGTARECIDEYSPDVVLILYNPNQIDEEDTHMFNFGIP